MDSQIIIAARLESMGKYQEALVAYEKIIIEKLNDTDALYLRRSIAACKYYLKDYTNAEKLFIKILEEDKINANEREDAEDCLYLCYLYGNKIEKAEKYFMNKLKLSENNYEENLWNYWYLGQINYLKKDYPKAEFMYMNALEAAKKANNVKIKFFLAHLLCIEIILKKYNKAWENIEKNSNYEDKSSGLYKIVLGILKKCTYPSDNNWKKIYDEGMKEAKSEKFEENIELGKLLLKITDSVLKEQISQFLDEEGRIVRWPKKTSDKINVLKYLQGKFEPDKKYSEVEVNAVLKTWHTFNDHALLRRELFDKFLLERTPDCKEYWVNTNKIII